MDCLIVDRNPLVAPAPSGVKQCFAPGFNGLKAFMGRMTARGSVDANAGPDRLGPDDRAVVPVGRKPLKRFFKRFAIAFLLLVFGIPFLLLLVYRVEAVRPVSTLMIQEALVGTGAKREWVELDDMAPVIYQSVLMSEDGQFCFHYGIDWKALNKVIDDAIEGAKTRGASTITMQLVKNLFLWPERSIIRKGLEVPYALMAEAILGKRRIMEIYLNIVELDDGIFGVGAASRHYFRREAAQMGPRYSALLAVTLPNPRARNPAKPSRRLRALASTIQKRARASGAYIQCLKA